MSTFAAVNITSVQDLQSAIYNLLYAVIAGIILAAVQWITQYAQIQLNHKEKISLLSPPNSSSSSATTPIQRQATEPSS